MADSIELATLVKRTTRERPSLDLAERVLTGKLVARGTSETNEPVKRKTNAPSETNASTGWDRRKYQRDYMKRWRAKKKPSV